MFSYKTTISLVILFLIASTNGVPVDPMINPDLFEGDIMGIDASIIENQKGAAQIPTANRKLWNNGVVPYVIDAAYNSTHRATILSGMKYLEDEVRVNGKYCIKFVPRTIETNWIRVYPGGGCSSFVGQFTAQGSQDLSLAIPGCLYNAIVAHEFLHALGFWHEQSRPDRDDYVKIHYENIQSGYENNFNIYTTNQVNYLGLPYDYDSVMHYGAKDFSSNGEATIVPVKPGVVIGQRKYVSEIDILEVQRFYGCVPFPRV